MARTSLLILLVVALLFELLLTAGGFFAPDMLLEKFGAGVTADTRFLAFVVAWLLLFVSLAIVLALVWVGRRHAGYPALCYLLGFWWMGIGLGLYLVYGRFDNLLLDGLKGLLLVLATWATRRAEANRLTGS
ncbi:hypothetical protein [Hymenobacter psychrophilus]|uniref:DoxX-like family protein n=1 Tax=Hymenobacter psychrophilus TaxID=651662 RepID=A0A1H3FKP8_9BACT|nr:hypothetical protein [Hymenobacter psychrophilus]SDX90714.1 hypothetical protein SAMN04488069_10489 [Hymenobacter psychrophilus]